jgi:hypothetical protein
VNVHEELGIDFHWDVRKLWAADLPTVELDVTELSWLLDLPFWTVDQRSDLRDPLPHQACWQRDL